MEDTLDVNKNVITASDQLDLSFPAFKVKVVERVKMTSKDERQDILDRCNYNLFLVRAEDVMVDFLTDSGTGALSKEQMAVMHLADESYACSNSWYKFKHAVSNLFDFKHIIPTHQGRAAERILFSSCCSHQKIVPNNTHFDTTRANIEKCNAVAIDLPIPEAKDPEFLHPFKGNMDVSALENLLQEHAADVPLVMITLTNNAGGGQPVSLENLHCVSAICRNYGKPLFLDACRFAENAWFIKQREAKYRESSIVEIVREIASLADGMTMSAKKDGLSHIGGWLAMNDDILAEKCNENLILTEGFTTYGGLAGRDLEIIAQGLKEVVMEEYLSQRVEQVQYFGKCLIEAGVPIIQPVGGHAVYIDAKQLLPHIPPLCYPAQALAVELYLKGGIRGCEIGTVMFGSCRNGAEKPATLELVRLAVPRRVYTMEHIDYAVAIIKRVIAKRSSITGMRIKRQPSSLRHFTAEFEFDDNVPMTM